MFFDILKFRHNSQPKDLGFEKFYIYPDIANRIKNTKDLQEAVNYKNNQSLIILNDYAIDDGALKLIGEKAKACFLIDLSRIIRSRGMRRVIELSRLRNFLIFCKKYKVKFTFASFATEEQALRTARELIHVGLILDLNLEEVKNALKLVSDYLG